MHKSYGQTLSEQLGGVKTEFVILSASDTMEVLDQQIIKRGLSDWGNGVSYSSEKASAYGYGLETFRFEFSSKDTLRKVTSSRKKRQRYFLQAYDENGSLLMCDYLKRGDVWFRSNGSGISIYSVNLQGVPLVSLNKTKYLRFTRVRLN